MTFIPKTPDWRLLPTELREQLYETLRSRSRLAAFTKLTPIEMAARFGFSDLIRDGQVTLHRIEQQLSQDEVTTPCEEEHPEAMARWKDQTSAPRLSFAHHGFTLANDMRRREYSDKEIAHALAVLKSNGGNVWRSSAELGIPYQTLRTWKRGKGKRLQTADVTQLHKEKELSLAAGCEKVLWKLLKYGLDPKKLKEANARRDCNLLRYLHRQDANPPRSRATSERSRQERRRVDQASRCRAG